MQTHPAMLPFFPNKYNFVRKKSRERACVRAEADAMVKRDTPVRERAAKAGVTVAPCRRAFVRSSPMTAHRRQLACARERLSERTRRSRRQKWRGRRKIPDAPPSSKLGSNAAHRCRREQRKLASLSPKRKLATLIEDDTKNQSRRRSHGPSSR